jgi:hypothetical protein
MKTMLKAAVALVVLCMGAAFAADTSFAGTWALDKAKSEGLQGRMGNAEQTWTVTQDEKTLTVERKTVVEGGEDRPAEKSVYNLDGSESKVERTGRMTGTATLTAKWSEDKKSVTLSSVMKTKRGENDVTITSSEKWELADDGKTLKVARTSEGGGANAQKRESKLVFAKK